MATRHRAVFLFFLFTAFLPALAFAAGPEEPLVVSTWRLENLDAGPAMTLLRSLLGVRNLAADESQRLIAATDEPERIAALDALLRRLDQPADEVTFDVALVQIDSPALEGLDTSAGIPRDTWANLVAAARVRPLATTQVGVVGAKPGTVELRTRVGDDRVVGLELILGSRVDRASRQILATIDLDVTTMPGLIPAEGAAARLQRTHSTLRLADGATLLVAIPGLASLDIGPQGGAEPTWATAVTPHLVRVGTSTAADPIHVAARRPEAPPAAAGEAGH